MIVDLHIESFVELGAGGLLFPMVEVVWALSVWQYVRDDGILFGER